MSKNLDSSVKVLGMFIFLGFIGLGYFFERATKEYRSSERSVTVKGLAEKEVTANLVVWPIQFRVTGNELGEVDKKLSEDNKKIIKFLTENGIEENEITTSAPNIEDRLIYQYGENKSVFRYLASETITVYSGKVDKIYDLNNKIGELLKQNISLNGDNREETSVNYLYTDLNELKPEMVESSAKNAREVAEKFAKDSNSKLGKIKKANQGQFIIENRDIHNPQIKRVRVVSTVEYYLAD